MRLSLSLYLPPLCLQLALSLSILTLPSLSLLPALQLLTRKSPVSTILSPPTSPPKLPTSSVAYVPPLFLPSPFPPFFSLPVLIFCFLRSFDSSSASNLRTASPSRTAPCTRGSRNTRSGRLRSPNPLPPLLFLVQTSLLHYTIPPSPPYSSPSFALPLATRTRSVGFVVLLSGAFLPFLFLSSFPSFTLYEAIEARFCASPFDRDGREREAERREAKSFSSRLFRSCDEGEGRGSGTESLFVSLHYDKVRSRTGAREKAIKRERNRKGVVVVVSSDRVRVDAHLLQTLTGVLFRLFRAVVAVESGFQSAGDAAYAHGRRRSVSSISRKGREGRRERRDAPVLMHHLGMLDIILLRLFVVVLPPSSRVRARGRGGLGLLRRARRSRFFVVGGKVAVGCFEVVHHVLGVLLRGSKPVRGGRREGRGVSGRGRGKGLKGRTSRVSALSFLLCAAAAYPA